MTALMIALVLGVPVAGGCLTYLYLDASEFGAALSGCGLAYLVLSTLMACAYARHRRMCKSLGKPFQAGDRVEVVSGPLQGERGTVEFPGQGGPLTLYVKLDSSAEDESIVFSWHHLRRAE